MKRILPVLILLSLALTACSANNPTPAPFDIIQTSVSQTLTAYPTQTPMVVTSTPLETPQSILPPALPTETPSATTDAAQPAVPAQPAAPVIIYVYPTANPPVIVYPTAAPVWSPAYADQFIYYYFEKINQRDYTTTWSLLTNAFKAAVNPESSGGYTGYVNFWNSVSRVDVSYVSVNTWSGNTATVVATMVYNYANGVVNSSSQTYHLYFDSYRYTWMFDTAAAAAATDTPSPTTPSQFIYNYFSNLNARNYGITWSLLSPAFISRNNPDGYTGYVNFWNSVSYVEITNVIVNSATSSTADVTVGLTLHYTSGLVTSSNVVYHLIYNYTIGSWQFN